MSSLSTQQAQAADAARKQAQAQAQAQAQQQSQATETARRQAAAQAQAQTELQQQEDKTFAPFKGMTIYDTAQMMKDLAPYGGGGSLNWHPAAYFLRGNNNYLTLPGGKISDRFGMSSPVTVDAYFKDKTNYPSNVQFPYNPPTVDLAGLRQYHKI